MFILIFPLAAIAAGAYYLWLGSHPSDRAIEQLRRFPFPWFRSPRGLRWTGVALIVAGAFFLIQYLGVLPR
jgi:hypothetical protein